MPRWQLQSRVVDKPFEAHSPHGAKTGHFAAGSLTGHQFASFVHHLELVRTGPSR